MKCEDCNQEMNTAQTCLFPLIKIEGKIYPRSRYHFGEDSGRCHDCGIKHNKIHHQGCDVERCPKCNAQLISCDCEKECVMKDENDN